MNERKLRVQVSRVTGFRLVCPNPDYKAAIEVSASRIISGAKNDIGPISRCPLCREEYGAFLGGHNTLNQLAEAVRNIQTPNPHAPASGVVEVSLVFPDDSPP